MGKTNKVKVVIADDHKMFLSGLASQLEQECDVIGTAANAKDLYEILANSCPEVLLLDIDLGNDDGVKLCEDIVNSHLNIRVIALTMHDEGSYVRKMIEAGAKGYLLKESSMKEVIKAIHVVHDQKTYFSPKASMNMMDSLVMQTPQTSIRLSKREKEVLGLILKEHTTDEIAKLLYVSKHTVETHRGNLIAKMNVRNVAGLVKKTMELQVLEL